MVTIHTKKIKGMCLLFAVICLLMGCGGKSPDVAQAGHEDEAIINVPEKNEEEVKEVSYSVWNAYWNLEGAEAQTQALAEHIQNVNFFAAYFDEKDSVFIPEATQDFYASNATSYRDQGWNCYLTVVNDQILADGSSSLKSTELLYRLLEREESYQAHAESLITLAKDAGYDGLEIDYENIRKDAVLWQYFMNFTKYLYDRCIEEGLLLRIVIETNIDAEKIAWVEGPTYCVMCYNLYGSHSGPGPKADRVFLEEVVEKMRCVPGMVDYALANGGFDWSEDGSVKGLTVKQAEILMAEYGAEAQTDESAAKYFKYVDEDGTSHEVWYGDQETLEIWMGWLQAGDNWNYSIWRLGE